ncbi:SagB/ThcOx family dehydrogenase [Leptolyngbya cf. ectocarpi LEGE 11479]|uniref:SagB/ThcOx family dehydrogenase n=1 Tax=Leptolyngbya cf. ectocarpi LEGE 11479 TaxID=1828722 RepID=A0A928X119_LEPEC|nr:SagB/ThcOx family dehydrogenase [Leptolyngbya ectocarpi]MBE9065871.1 SagB/ThcOx family dehydrogenase [Leptolyngbya cf. ectocarpi LEGE 11479]
MATTKRLIKRRDLDYVVITLLVGSSLYVFITGLIADAMGLHHFGFHSQVGYLWVALAATHLIQTWARVKAFVRNRFREKSKPPIENPAQSVTVQPTEIHPTENRSASQRFSLSTSGRRNLLLFLLAIATGVGFERFVTPQKTIGLSDELSDVDQDVGLLYHQWSQPGYGETIATILNWGQEPPRYKTYPASEQIALPQVESANASAMTTLNLATAVTNRRSHRRYNTQAQLSLTQLSQLLFLAQGITWDEREFRTVPSSGALYPLELYPIVHRVEGLQAGLYHHAVQSHGLELIKAGDLRQPLIKAGLSQDFLGEAQVCFVVSGIFQRTRWKYHERTYRYVLMEAGHLGQNLYLAATALGLGVCGVGAFFDDPLNELLGIEGKEEAALYLVTVGAIS